MSRPGGMRALVAAILWCGFAPWLVGPARADAPQTEARMQELTTTGFTDLGIPVRRSALYNHVLARDAQGRECYYQAYRGNPWFLVAVDLETGASREYISGRQGNPYGMIRASNGRIYISTGGSGEDALFVFDPTDEELRYLGRPTETEQVVWTLCEAENGKIYGGTYPNAKLISIDLKTHELADLGRIPSDQPYIRFLDTARRYVYCNVGPSKAEVWAWNMDTGERTQILPAEFAEGLSWGTAQKRLDGRIYIKTPKRVFRVDGLELTPVDKQPDARPENWQGKPTASPLTLSDGRRISVAHDSGPAKYFNVTEPDGAQRTVPVEYTGSPTTLWAVEEGPDGLIYGTTRSPITLFSYDPRTSMTRVLGDPIGKHGQVYGWAWLNGRLYMAAYGSSRVTVWDPVRPWRFGTKPDANPRYIGSCHIGRPASLIVAPDGIHLLAGGVPGYGQIGGVLTVIDPETSDIQVVKGVAGQHSIASMAVVPETSLVCIGTTWRGGSATKAVKSDAKLMLWDFETRKTVFETAPLPGLDAITQMVCVEGKMVCTTRDEGHLIVFDPRERRVVHAAPLGFGGACLFGLRYRVVDKKLYAISGETLVRIDPGTYAIERLGSHPDMEYGMAFSDDSLYFCAGAHLIRFRIPPAPLSQPK